MARDSPPSRAPGALGDDVEQEPSYDRQGADGPTADGSHPTARLAAPTASHAIGAVFNGPRQIAAPMSAGRR